MKFVLKDETVILRIGGKLVRMAAGVDVEIEFPGIEQRAWLVGECGRVGIVTDNPHGYRLDGLGRPVCEHCYTCIDARFINTPGLVCSNCGMHLKKGGS